MEELLDQVLNELKLVRSEIKELKPIKSKIEELEPIKSEIKEIIAIQAKTMLTVDGIMEKVAQNTGHLAEITEKLDAIERGMNFIKLKQLETEEDVFSLKGVLTGGLKSK
ncbi:hypothetical protein HX99_01770 [Peptococcaceae bacterium SCADC1_2_3]|jgi:methyl-accepting chemotaxis protein|nr:hypothetical protein DK28_0203360 [Peptococcaceae bacterium SCADC1_2_3]KFI35837.1 hypothetical protein HY00_00780 [Peptococcaceae bacterium SCADC1_2_3]KFI36738.1 hypothetical protein HX99_01770 [Peptococcaceae bacterium SCADC1_2_3]KFI37485.1 hypothetical protein HY02_06325 [Peptococcaceae bacterium SCADC1_2_3]